MSNKKMDSDLALLAKKYYKQGKTHALNLGKDYYKRGKKTTKKYYNYGRKKIGKNIRKTASNHFNYGKKIASAKINKYKKK